MSRWASRTWAFESANFLPPLRPRARAALSPARVRSRISSPLELGQRREDAEYEAAGRGGGVDLRALAGEHPQAHLASRQVLHGVDQMGQVTAEAVELPDDEHVALAQEAQAAVEPRPVVAEAGDEVVVEVDLVNAGHRRATRKRLA